MDKWPPGDYRAAASKQGLAPDVASNALEQANAVLVRGLPAILSLGHLAWHTEVGYTYLRRIVARDGDPYRRFWMKKRSGGKRLICVPDADLLTVQRWINRYVLSLQKPHSASCAYAPGSSAVMCAKHHLGAAWLVKLDIRQFFESISEIQVYRVFRSLGYEALIAFELARLCTRVLVGRSRAERAPWIAKVDKYLAIPRYPNAEIGHLPQGAPTSPMLANLALKGFDASVEKIAGESGLTYTRYSDDVVLSSTDHGFGRKAALGVVAKVHSCMRALGLRPRTAKTIVVPPGSRKVVLGLLVDRSELHLSRQARRKLECHLHYLQKFGPAQHALRRGFDSISGLREHVLGLICYAEHVDPGFGKEMRSAFQMVQWP